MNSSFINTPKNRLDCFVLLMQFVLLMFLHFKRSGSKYEPSKPVSIAKRYRSRDPLLYSITHYFIADYTPCCSFGTFKTFIECVVVKTTIPFANYLRATAFLHEKYWSRGKVGCLGGRWKRGEGG